MARRFGMSPCVLAGFAHTSGDAVIYMDADLQDPPELIPQMIQEWRKGCDVVNTTRLTRQGETRTKMWITKLGYQIINLLSDTDIPMNTGDFKLLSRRVVNELLKLNEYDPFLRGLVRWVGFKQVQLFYDRHARHSGITHFNWRSSSHASAMISGITSFSSTPLYVSFIVGLGVARRIHLSACDRIDAGDLGHAPAWLAVGNGDDAVLRRTEFGQQRRPEHLRGAESAAK